MREKDSDQSLVKRFQHGDMDAFELFVRRHQDRIYRLALGFLWSSSDAADATQEVFLRAMSGLMKFRFRASPFTWLYRTTRNVCRELNRRRPLVAEPGGAEPAATENGMLEQLSDSECATAVRNVIAGLPDRQRDVVILRYFEELSVDDTAKALGCRPGTVKALMHKAMNKLKQSDDTELLKHGETDSDESIR